MPGTFHFTAGPYLNYATQHSINVLWETDRPAKATIEWGTTAQLGESYSLVAAKTIQEFQIADLKPHTPYFYRITADDAGERIDSGILTFQTAVREDEPYKFAIIGDTETRPHINNQVAQLIWTERPNFVVNLGDLTDGGMRDKKYQWNLEYFSGITSLGSSVPFFPVSLTEHHSSCGGQQSRQCQRALAHRGSLTNSHATHIASRCRFQSKRVGNRDSLGHRLQTSALFLRISV